MTSRIGILTMTTAILAAALLFPPAAPAKQENAAWIDNPEYPLWANFKPGSMVEQQTTVKTSGQKFVTTATTRIKSVTKVRVMLQMTTQMMGVVHEMDREVPARIRKPDPPKEKPRVKYGSEIITVPAGTFSCKWAETSQTIQGMKMKTKVWQSKEVPGGMVKMTSHSSANTTEMLLMKMIAHPA